MSLSDLWQIKCHWFYLNIMALCSKTIKVIFSGKRNMIPRSFRVEKTQPLHWWDANFEVGLRDSWCFRKNKITLTLIISAQSVSSVWRMFNQKILTPFSQKIIRCSHKWKDLVRYFRTGRKQEIISGRHNGNNLKLHLYMEFTSWVQLSLQKQL